MKYPGITIALLKRLNRHIKKVTQHLECDHEFVEYGLGYKCNKCDLYTGTNSEFNSEIEKKKR